MPLHRVFHRPLHPVLHKFGWVAGYQPPDLTFLFDGTTASYDYDVQDMSTLWADTAGTTPAELDGTLSRIDTKGDIRTQPVVRFADGDEATLIRDPSGMLWARSTGASRFNMDPGSSDLATPNTVIAIFRLPGLPDSLRPFFDGAAEAGSGNRHYLGVTSDNRLAMWAGTTFGFQFSGPPRINEPDFAVAVFDGESSFMESVLTIANSNSINSTSARGITLFSHQSGSPKLAVDLHRVIVLNRRITTEERALLIERLRAAFSVPTVDWAGEDIVAKSGAVGSTQQGYGSLAANGEIYCAPFNGDVSLVINPDAGTVRGLDLGTGNGGHLGAVSIGDKVYYVPFASDKPFLVADTADADALSTITITGRDSAHQWYRSVSDGTYLYLLPYAGGRVCRVDLSDDSASLYGDALPHTSAASFGFGPLVDGKIYLPGRNRSVLIVFDTATGTYDAFDMGASGIGASGNGHYSGGVYHAPTNRVYFTPRAETRFMYFDIASQTINYFGSGLQEIDRKWGAELLIDDKIYLLWRNENRHVEIDPYTLNWRYLGVQYRGPVTFQSFVGAVRIGDEIFGIPFDAGFVRKWTVL